MSDERDEGEGWRDRVEGWRGRAQREARAFADRATETAARAKREAGGLAERAAEARKVFASSPYYARANAAADEVRAWSDRVAKSPALAAARAALEQSAPFRELTALAARARETEAWAQLERAAERADQARQTAVQRAQEQVEWARTHIEIIAGAIDAAESHPQDREVVLAAAARAFESVGSQLDMLADAVGIGSLREAGAGLTSLQGTEIIYVPADGPVRAQLRVSRLAGQAARLALGGQVGAHIVGYYGPRAAVVRPMSRRGGDLGLIALSLGFFRGLPERGGGAIGGWLMELSAGVGLGIPVLSDLSGFELEEIPLATYSLTEAEAEPFDAALAAAPDRPHRRGIARMLMRDVDGKPG